MSTITSANEEQVAFGAERVPPLAVRGPIA
jgi:hypothetical protein